jgi:L-alanine-DL-glutamate epimerase-like enolase superfamily enzyme
MLDDRNRYRPRTLEELASDPAPVSWINQPVPPDNVATLVPRQRSIHAVLVESLNSAQALLTRLEHPGVSVPRRRWRRCWSSTA